MLVAILILLTCLLQFGYFFVLYPLTRRITNLVKSYVLGVEVWSAFSILGVTLFQAIIWNNTAPYFNSTADKVFENHLVYTNENVMKNLTDSTNYDLGNITETYQALINKVLFH